jgi:hypothetical protein
VIAALLAPPGPGRDVFFEQVTVTSVDGKSTGPGVTSRLWSSGRRLRLEVGEGPDAPALIVLLDEGHALRLDPVEKVAEKVGLDRLRARSHADASVAGDLMGAAEEGSVRSRPLGTSRTVAGHACEDYRITGPLLRMDVCVGVSIPLRVDAFADLLEWSGAEQSLGGILAAVRRLPGFPLETRTRVEVVGRLHQTRATIKRIRVGPQPQDLFAPPPGYRLVAEPAEP